MLQRCLEYLEFLKNKMQRIVYMLSFADLSSCEELKQSAKRMVEHKFTPYHQEAFMQLSHDLLIDILSSDNLNASTVRSCYAMGWSTTQNHDRSICLQFLAKSELMHFQK